MASNRAPGLDGVTSSFIKAYWKIVGKDFCKVIREFFSSGIMPTSWKETAIVLIPKFDNPCRPDMLRPISLCKAIYKVVAKILVERLKCILPNIISEEQAACIPGRSISNHIILAKEVINKFKCSNSSSSMLMAKIDMSQAYDKMSWKTLLQVLNLLKFPLKFIDIVINCIKDLGYCFDH